MTDPAPVVYLHIGAMKTGTTYLQALLGSHKAQLAEVGYLFPGRRWRDQDRATRDVLQMHLTDPAMRASCDGKWKQLADEMVAYQGHASIFSMEFLSFASPAQAQEIVASLPGARVHVILTVRDAVGAIPAQWQTHSRNGGKASWPAFARSASRRARFGGLDQGEGARTFNRTQGIPRMLRAWAPVLQPGHLHVVTVPPNGSDQRLLWERFASVVGVDPDVCSGTVKRTNPSLGQPSADLMRRINADLGRMLTSDYSVTLKKELANTILAARSAQEPGARLDRRRLRHAIAWNRRVRKEILRSEAVVVGELDDLPVRVDQVEIEPAEKLTNPTEEAVLAAAATAHDGLISLVRRRGRRVIKLGAALGPGAQPGKRRRKRQVRMRRKQLRETLRTIGVTPGQGKLSPTSRWTQSSDPVGSAVAELAALARLAIDLHHQTRALRRRRERLRP